MVKPSTPRPRPTDRPDEDMDAAPVSRVDADHKLDVELRYLVLAAQREGNRKLSRDLDAIGLTPAQAEVLLVLAEREPLTLVELGRCIVCETGSPSRIVGRSCAVRPFQRPAVSDGGADRRPLPRRRHRIRAGAG